MTKYFVLIFCTCSFNFSLLTAQKSVTKNIHSFGARGDGKTNDTEAFVKAAAFFNERGGYGTLVIPKGVYIVGKQSFSNGDVTKYAYTGVDILDLKNLRNVAIQGEKGTILKYDVHLKLGSFDPVSGKIYNDNNPALPAVKYAGHIGNCIALTDCKNISVKNLVLDGNNKSIEFGGRYDDKGIQLTHSGICIKNCHSIFIDAVNASYFGLDGVEVINTASKERDDIFISNSTFEYNCRQGMSWVGGNYLFAKNCLFNHSGRSGYFSPPGAGVDFEAEVGDITNGSFESCQFINNSGCGMLTGGGIVSNCRFTNCTFWGTSSWSVWVEAPAFTFTGCKMYGSIVKGYDAAKASEGTRFIRCLFEDKPYMGQPCYGKFLAECDGPRWLLFDSCTFVPHAKPLYWIRTAEAKSAEERATVRNSHFNLPKKDERNRPLSSTIINFYNNKTEYKN